MIISLIVAVSQNNVIGKDNKLPWHLPIDLKYFKNITWAMPVVMGRKTFESMGKPLSGRANIVITRNKEWQAQGVKAVKSIDEAIIAATELDANEIFIIGGAEIFRSALPLADKLYLTLIHENFDGDVFLPEINLNQWKLVKSKDVQPDDKTPYPLSFQLWERK